MIPAAAKLRRDAIRLTSTAAADKTIKIGASKIGGAPDLPKGTAWPLGKIALPKRHRPITGGIANHPLPEDGVIPLPFVAQIALANVTKLDTKRELPKTGLLSFFYNGIAYSQRVGRKLEFVGFGEPGNWRVIYTPSMKGLARLAIPDGVPQEGRYPSLRLARPKREPTYPSIETAWFDTLALTPEQHFEYTTEWDDARANRVTHMLLGHSDDMQPYALENSYARTHGTLFPEEKPLPKQGPGSAYTFRRGRLLLQISSEGDLWFGRSGRLYFFIREDDLAAARFDRVWANEQ